MSHGFLAELNRRHVIRVAAAYLVIGLLLGGLALWVFPLFAIPAWSARLVCTLIALGFPLVLILAWVYELTPEGVRRTEPADSSDAREPTQRLRVGKHINAIVIVLLSLAVAFMLWREFRPAQTTQPAVATSAAAAGEAQAAKSIAVLPFESLSADAANGFFAGGIQDEILTGLSRIADLKVISRSSTLRYANEPINITEIARQLAVVHLLTGSVQKSGDRVRINVQLIDARNQRQVWARTYDRTLDDVFAVESEVARMIAESLQAQLTGAERAALSVKPTANAEAYAAYLKGRALNERSSFDRANTAESLATYQRAVALDPNFALAWAELVKLNIWQYWEGYGSGAASLEAARTALAHARALAPTLPQVEIARGWFLYYGERKFDSALAAFRSAQHGLPNNDQTFVGAALVERRLAQWPAATRDLERARELNPNGLEILAILGESLIAQREFERAENAVDAGLALKPSDPFLLDMKAICLFNAHRDWQQIDRILAGFPETAASIGSRATSALYQRRFDEASALFERAIAAAVKENSPDNYKDYIPTPTALRLGLALSEQRRGKPESAASVYRTIKTDAAAALAAKPDNLNVRTALFAVLGMAEAGLGEHAAAVADGQHAAILIPEASDAVDGPAWQRYLARIYAMNGDAERALPLLTHLLRIDTPDPQTIRLLELDPVWDPLRSDARFQALVSRQ